MTIVEAVILGMVQGITEFFPVSSSGHLKLIQIFLGFQNLSEYLPFDLVCHLGTLFAIFFVFRQDIQNLFGQERKTLALIVVGSLPLLPLYPFLDIFKESFNQPRFLGLFFFTTGLLLFCAETQFKKTQGKLKKNHTWMDALCIGLFQAAALFPGISRSGSTISAASFLGWERNEAARFSFLLAIPPILGGSFLEFFHLLSKEEGSVHLSTFHYLAGFTTSFLVGCGALVGILSLVKKKKLRPFAWYCCILGIGTLIFINFI